MERTSASGVSAPLTGRPFGVWCETPADADGPLMVCDGRGCRPSGPQGLPLGPLVGPPWAPLARGAGV